MKVKLFNEFKNETILKNNRKYNQFLSNFKDEIDQKLKRSNVVAWGAPGSQLENFQLVSKYIEKGETLLDYGCGIGDFIEHLLNVDKEPSNYLGVDINRNYIEIASDSYPDNKFKLIRSIDDIGDNKWDNICAIGVFTWYIDKEDFINIINKLYNSCNKNLLLTFLYRKDVKYDKEGYWDSKYRYYNEELFKTLFPNYNIQYELNSTKSTLLVKIKH